MKKTLITLILMSLGFTCGAEKIDVIATGTLTISPSAAVTKTIDEVFTASENHKLSEITNTGSNSYTVQIYLPDWIRGNSDLLTFSTATSGNLYQSANFNLGYANAVDSALLYNNSGSSSGASITYTDGLLSQTTMKASTPIAPTTLFVTVSGSTATLYETVSTTNKVAQIQTFSGYSGVGQVKTISGGNWAGSGTASTAGTLNMTIYSGVLTTEQMNSVVTPEPATATLSLLALAGLAARRRRLR